MYKEITEVQSVRDVQHEKHGVRNIDRDTVLDINSVRRVLDKQR